MFRRRLTKDISQKESRKLMIIRSQEKWKPIGLEGASGKALDPQGINRMIFGLISQVARIGV